MSPFSDVRETSVRYGGYVAEFKELLRKNELRFGEAEDFFQLAPKLAYHGEFRTAFTGLTESVRKREDGKLTLARMLTVIAIAMGGQEIETLGSASVVPISLVVVFLAGVGGWSEAEPGIVMKAPQEQASNDVKLPAHHLDSIGQRNERIEPQNHVDQIASRIEPPPNFRPRIEGYGPPRGLLEELAAIEASFRARKLSETEPVEADALNFVDKSVVEAMLRAAKLEKAEATEVHAPVVADRYKAEATPYESELPNEDVVAPVVEERKALEVKVQSVEPLIEPPKVEAVRIAAPVVIANKYESVGVQGLHRMIAVVAVLLFLLVGFAAVLLYHDRDWRVQTLVKNRWVNAGSFASDGKAGLPSPDRGAGTSNKVPTQSKTSGNVGPGELSGGRAKGPTDIGLNRKVQDHTVMNQAHARGQAKQPPVLESAPAKPAGGGAGDVQNLGLAGPAPFSFALILLALLWVPTAGVLIVTNLVKKRRTDAPTLIVFGFALLVLGLLQVPSGAWQRIFTWR